MIELTLNLLPPHLRAQREEARRRRLLYLPPVLVLVVLLIFFINLSSQVSAVQREARDLELQALPLRRLVLRHDALLKTQNELRSRIAVAASVTGRSSTRWSAVLTDIGRAIPDDTWLVSLAASERGFLEINGVALSYEGVARFAAGLGTSPFIGQVEVSFVRQELRGTRRVMDFRVVCRVQEAPRP